MTKVNNNGLTSTRVILKDVRFAYSHVFEKDDLNQKYTCRILLAKNSPQVKDLRSAWDAAVKAGAAKLAGKLPPRFEDCIHDGDIEGKTEDYKGVFYLNAKSKDKPGVVKINTTGIGGKTTNITDPDEFYSGCYGMASISFYAYYNSGKSGIGVALNNVCKTSDGDYLGGGRTSAEDDFGGGAADIDDLPE